MRLTASDPVLDVALGHALMQDCVCNAEVSQVPTIPHEWLQMLQKASLSLGISCGSSTMGHCQAW